MHLIKFLIGVPFFFRDKALFFMRKHIAKLKEHTKVCFQKVLMSNEIVMKTKTATID